MALRLPSGASLFGDGFGIEACGSGSTSMSDGVAGATGMSLSFDRSTATTPLGPSSETAGATGGIGSEAVETADAQLASMTLRIMGFA